MGRGGGGEEETEREIRAPSRPIKPFLFRCRCHHFQNISGLYSREKNKSGLSLSSPRVLSFLLIIKRFREKDRLKDTARQPETIFLFFMLTLIHFSQFLQPRESQTFRCKTVTYGKLIKHYNTVTQMTVSMESSLSFSISKT